MTIKRQARRTEMVRRACILYQETASAYLPAAAAPLVSPATALMAETVAAMSCMLLGTMILVALPSATRSMASMLRRASTVSYTQLDVYKRQVREYESDLLLKLELERRGYTAEIRQLLDPKHLRLFGRDTPEVLVASCMYDNEAINSHVYNNIGRCNKIVNLHWEQMLSDTQEEGDWFNMNGNAKR